MYFRPAGPWCMAFYTGSCFNKTQAQSNCKGQLSGLDSDDEYAYLKGNTARWTNYTQFSGAWLDGQRKSECVGQTTDACQGIKAFQFTDPTLSANPAGYHFNPGKPDATSGDCLGYRVNADKTFGVENFPCDTASNATLNICFQGYLCGVAPIPV
ncbi:hypothetical protein CAEBREN_15042 [Caenorhabditis brenneri]|uniref:C-type lectin domain-containing protein n=1 Tax=Caenorhabditis brenneri TaxID=135651 RepID=G0NCJ2_CAEBE|nr:hypothetical protein CAEBREN_15042 [Caenorhabditis brenneri]